MTKLKRQPNPINLHLALIAHTLQNATALTATSFAQIIIAAMNAGQIKCNKPSIICMLYIITFSNKTLSFIFSFIIIFVCLSAVYVLLQ